MDYPPIDPEQPAFVRVPVKAIPTIIAALKAAGMEQEAAEAESFTRHYTDPAANAYRLEVLEKANELQVYGEVEFDSDATISESDEDGEYVLAWVWVDIEKGGGE